MNREEAIKVAGIEAVEAVEAMNCEPINMAGHNGICQGDADRAWSSEVYFLDADGDEQTLRAYYYLDNEEEDRLAKFEWDGSYIDWVIAEYEVG